MPSPASPDLLAVRVLTPLSSRPLRATCQGLRQRRRAKHYGGMTGQASGEALTAFNPAIRTVMLLSAVCVALAGCIGLALIGPVGNTEIADPVK